MGARDRVTTMLSRTAALISPDLMEDRLRNPFFFIGCGRSGTTLLANLLASHRDIAAYPYEANEMWHPKLYPWYRSNRQTAPIWVDPYAFTQSSLASRTEHDDRQMKAVFGACQFILRGKCFVNKSVLITFMIPYVLKLFPEARFIHIVRDGRAVALSFAIKERKMIEKFPEPYQKSRIDFPFEVLLEKFADHWKQHILEIEKQKVNLNLINKGLLYELSYEDLCAKPYEQLTLIAGFMGLAPQGFCHRDYSQIESTNHKYQEKLDLATIRHISKIMQPVLKAKNYPAY